MIGSIHRRRAREGEVGEESWTEGGVGTGAFTQLLDITALGSDNSASSVPINA